MKVLPTRDALHLGIVGPSSPRHFERFVRPDGEELPSGMGGTPVNHLLKAVLDLGHRATLVTLDPSVPPGSHRTFRGEQLTICVGPYRRQHRARDVFRVERAAVRRMLREEHPDAVSAHWSYEFALGSIESSIPTMVTVHDVPRRIFRLQPTPYRLIRWWMHRQALRGARAVAVNSPYTAASVGHVRTRNAIVLPNSLPEELWRVSDRVSPNRDAPWYVSVNHGFSVWKNVNTLLKAFSLVRQTARCARLTLVGLGYQEGGPAQQWAHRHGLDHGVEFSGPQPYAGVLDIIRSADVLVHPSLEESFGYTLLEANAVGTPTIGGQASGAVPWVLDGGNAGVLVDVRSPNALAHAMRHLVSDTEFWRRLRKTAHTTSKKRFSALNVAKRYVACLLQLVSGDHPVSTT